MVLISDVQLLEVTLRQGATLHLDLTAPRHQVTALHRQVTEPRHLDMAPRHQGTALRRPCMERRRRRSCICSSLCNHK
jgi:hypothetical protein